MEPYHPIKYYMLLWELISDAVESRNVPLYVSA